VTEIEQSQEELVERSDEFIEKGYFGPEALQVNERLTELVPGNASYWSRLGGCLKSADRLDDAIKAYERARALDPSQQVARAEITALKQSIKAQNEAKAIIKREGPQGLRKSVNAAKKVHGRALFCLEGRYLLLQEPGANIFDQIGLAGALGRTGQYERALGLYRQAAESDDAEAKAAATNGAAKIMRMMGRPKQAEKLYRKVLSKDSAGKNAFYALNGLGGVLKDQDRGDEADEAFKTAEQIRRKLGLEDTN
jgi:tetratricopeptide (TPR) repeat protein